MPPVPARTTCDPQVLEALLVRALDDVTARLGDVTDQPTDDAVAHLVGVPRCTVAHDDDPLELCLREVRGHPLSHLLSLHAPRSWDAVGVLGPASEHPIDAHGIDRSRPERVRFGLLVARTGASVWLRQPRDGDIVVDHAGATDQSLGLLHDGCLRALGLPTAPPPGGSEHLYAMLWLQSVVEATLGDGLVDGSWAEVARLHPVFDVIEPDEPDAAAVAGWAVRHLERAGLHQARAWPWSRLLAEGVGLAPFGDGLETWLDEGSYARLVCGNLPAVATMLDDLELLLAPATTVRMRRVLARWGLVAPGPTRVR